MLHLPLAGPGTAATRLESPGLRGTLPRPRVPAIARLLGVAQLCLSCGPRVSPGAAPARLAEESVQVETLVDPGTEGSRVELLLLAGGSRWDPPGQEGRSALALIARDPDVQVSVRRDRALIVAPCSERSGPSVCSFKAVSRAIGRDWHSDTLDAGVRRYWVDHLLLSTPEQALAPTVLYGLLFEGHPYAHPPLGRHGTLPSVSTPQVRAFFRDNVRRSTVRARAIAPTRPAAEAVASQLRTELDAVRTGLAPDAAMKGPPPADSVLAVGRASGATAHVAIGRSVPRRATQTTRLLPDAPQVGRWSDLRRCAGPALEALGFSLLDDAQAPPNWDATLRAPAHPALVWTLSGTPEVVLDAVRGLATAGLGAPEGPACDAVRPDIDELLRPDRFSGVVLWPDGIEDPWAGVVQDGAWTSQVRLPDSTQERLR